MKIISKLTDTYFDMDPNSQYLNTNWTFFRENLTILMNNPISPVNLAQFSQNPPLIARETKPAGICVVCYSR